MEADNRCDTMDFGQPGLDDRRTNDGKEDKCERTWSRDKRATHGNNENIQLRTATSI